MFKKVCEYCGKTYEARMRNHKYCSSKCSQLARKNGNTRQCPICGKNFYVSLSKDNQKYCCYKCKCIAQKEVNKIIAFDDRAEIEIETRKYGIKYAIIDLEDIDRIKNYKWCVTTRNGKTFYVIAAKSRKEKISLHRLITNCPDYLCVDHINHNPLDNRKKNLRVCTSTENAQNIITTNNKLGYQNIHRYRNKYRVKVTRFGKDIIKRVDTLEKAIKARDEILKSLEYNDHFDILECSCDFHSC